MKDPQEVAQAFSLVTNPDLGDGVVVLKIDHIPGQINVGESGSKGHVFANWVDACDFAAALTNRLNEQLSAIAPVQEPEPDAPKPVKAAKNGKPAASTAATEAI